MELPSVDGRSEPRQLTGEVVYLDEMRRNNLEPKVYTGLGSTAVQLYEEKAGRLRDNNDRPAIMDEYDSYETAVPEAVTRSVALADKLLAYKEEGSRLTFEDFVVKDSSIEVLNKLKAIKAGELLRPGNAELAIVSGGEYYPELSITKNQLDLKQASVRAWGWDNQKVVFTNAPNEQYSYPKNCLVYPSSEKLKSRELEVQFSYTSEEGGLWAESISMSADSLGRANISSNIWASAYSETGYEGHMGQSLEGLTNDDIVEFASLVAELVGDEPEAIWMRQAKALDTAVQAIELPEARAAVDRLVAATSKSRAFFILNNRREDGARLIDGLINRGREYRTIEYIEDLLAMQI